MMPDLPLEIQLFVLQHISQNDLTQIALVNKSWSAAANKLIWKSIRLMSIRQANIFLNGKDTHMRHIHHVETFQTRVLSTTNTLLNETNPRLTPRLRSLNIMVPTHRAYTSSELKRLRHCDDTRKLREERRNVHASTPEDEGGNNYLGDDAFADKASLTHDQEQPLLELLRRNPQLESFKLAMLPDDPSSFLIKLAPLLPQLKHIELFRVSKRLKPSMDIAVLAAFLLDMSSHVQTVTLNTICFAKEDLALEELLRPLRKSGKGKRHPDLKLLRIINNMGNNQATALVPFLEGCSSKLWMIETGMDVTPHWAHKLDWASLLPAFYSALERLSGCRIGTFRGRPLHYYNSNSHEETDEWIANKISTFKDTGDLKGRWHTINLANTQASSLTAKAIAACCQEGLTALSLARCQGIPSEDIQSILSKAVNLRYLECNAPGVDGYVPDPVLLASHVLQSNWVCTWLVRLSIHIGDIPRPDIKCNEAGRPVKAAGEPIDHCTVEESHTLQRRIYRQLGQLRLLEELFLGYASSQTLDDTEGYEADKAQRNCLEMSLESGLDELGGLKCLRVLAVAYMAHRIEAPELDWMQKNWPDFHTILGVLFRTYPVDKTRSGRGSAWRSMMQGRGLSFA